MLTTAKYYPYLMNFQRRFHETIGTQVVEVGEDKGGCKMYTFWPKGSTNNHLGGIVRIFPNVFFLAILRTKKKKNRAISFVKIRTTTPRDD